MEIDTAREGPAPLGDSLGHTYPVTYANPGSTPLTVIIAIGNSISWQAQGTYDLTASITPS